MLKKPQLKIIVSLQDNIGTNSKINRQKWKHGNLRSNTLVIMVFDVEDTISKLQSTEVKDKQATLDNLPNILSNNNIFSNLNIDVKLKMLNSIVATLQDANPKIVIAALGVIETIIETHFEHYQPLVNMSFDVLLLKLGDARASVRSSATSVMLRLIQAIGLIAGYERLNKHLQHKNHRIKDQILIILSQLTDAYSSDMLQLSLVSKLVPLLSDPTSTTRVLTSTLLHQLYCVAGEPLIDEIMSATSAGATVLRPAQIDAIRLGNGASAPSTSIAGFYATDPPKTSSKPPPSRPTSLSTGRNVKTSAGGSLPLHSTHLGKQSSGDSVNSRGTLSSGASTPTSASASTKYRPEHYMLLLSDGSSAPSSSSSNIASCVAQLENDEDWQARISALLTLQGIALGVAGTSKVEAAIQQLRPLAELVAKQIADLRSAVSKEASRTVAVLASPSFALLAEVWVPALVKLLAVKTQVIQSAADRALRILTTATTGGVAYARVYSVLLDACDAKAPATRALALEYICMAVALHKIESYEKHGTHLKRCIVKNLSDADPHARRTARHLYCLISNISSAQWQQLSSSIMADLDSSAAKHLQQEMTCPHADLHDLLNLKEALETYETLPPTISASNSDSDSISSGFAPAATPTTSSPVTIHDDSSVGKQSRVPKAFQRSRTPLGMRSTTVSSSDARRNGGNIIEDNNDTSGSAIPNPSARRMSVAPASTSDNDSATLSGTLGGSRRMSVGPMRVSRAVTTSTLGSESNLKHDTSAFSVTAAPAAALSDITTDDAFATTSGRPVSRGRPLWATGGMGGAQRIARPVKAEPATPTVANSTTSATVASNHSRKVTTGASSAASSTPTLDGTKTLKSSSRLVPTDDDISIGGSSAASKEQKITHEQIKTLLSSSKWNERCEGFQAISSRLPHLLSIVSSDSTVNGSARKHLDEYLDLSVSHLSDVHHKVVREAMIVVDMMISVKNVVLAGKLGVVIPALFQRLADKKSSNNSSGSANDLLDKCRAVYEAPVIMAALSPRLIEVPERLRVAIVQYMISIAPYCESYFSSDSSTGAFLNRLAVVLGASNTKPSAALVAAGTRLLYLVYKASTQTVLNQISSLPLQQQNTIKRLLQDQVPNIDSLAAAAGRAQWNSAHSKPSSKIATQPTLTAQAKMSTETDVESSPVDLTTPAIPQTPNRETATISATALSPSGLAACMTSTTTPASMTASAATPKPPPHPSTIKTPTTTPTVIHTVTTPPSPPVRDISWILWALRSDSDASRDEKLDAIREVRQLSRNASQEYWSANCGQILSVLLELFTFNPTDNAGEVCRPYAVPPRGVLAGFTPPHRQGEENRHENCHETDPSLGRLESMHFACKALQMLVKLQGYHVKNFMELLVSRLLKAASFAPVAVALHCEQILSDASALEPLRFIRLILPYIANAAAASDGVRLIALHTLAAAIKNLNSGQLLSVLDAVVPTVLPFFSSALVDTRKAVVFVLVEIYLIIGDALKPFVSDLSPSQRKLLTVYIERQIGKNDSRTAGVVL